MLISVWNTQYILALFENYSCPISFFTYLIIIVAAFIIAMTTILLVADRYLILTCPYLYDEHITKNSSTYGKIIAYIFIIALILSGIGFAISPQVLYLLITVLLIGCALWALFVFPALSYEYLAMTRIYTSYQLKLGICERRRQEVLTKFTAIHCFATVLLMTPHFVLTYGWFQKKQEIVAVWFHQAILWSWVLIGLKLVVSAVALSQGIPFKSVDEKSLEINKSKIPEIIKLTVEVEKVENIERSSDVN